MEKESFVEIVDGLVELINISDEFDKLVHNHVGFGMRQIEKIIEGLEIEFEDEEGWIRWWLLEAGKDKKLVISKIREPYQDDLGNWRYGDVIEHKFNLPTSEDLYDFLDYSNANS